MNGHCPIWGGKYSAQVERSARDGLTFVIASPRAGGSFKIEDTVRVALDLDDQEKARLTTWILDQNAKGAWLPEITREIVDYAKGVPPLPTYERANRLLRLIASRVEAVGYELEVSIADPHALAWSESVKPGEVDYFLRYLREQGWLTGGRTNSPEGISHRILVSVEGYRHIEVQETNALSSQGFIAMWFDKSMNEASDKGIELAIRDAGYDPLRIDKEDHTNKIDDEIIAQIRRSKFVVADFTYGKGGPRGGVYYEAGFAHGLNIEVFFSCRKDRLRNVHFDTRQYPHIVWETPEELRVALANKIQAVLGQGPKTPAT